MERLDKLLAGTGRWSRREVKNLVRQGRVLVDGVPARSAEDKADPETADIAVNGESITYRRYTWVMLNKPAGYLSATEDGRGPTVLDLLPPELRRQNLFPVGRLDKDTEGLLLLTNEGGLAHELLSPRHHVDKVYYVRTAGRLTEEDCRAFASGMTLDDGLAETLGELAEFDRPTTEAADLVGALVAAMTPPDRDIFLRKYYLLQSGKEIAAALGMSVESVNTRLSRGRDRLRLELTAKGVYSHA